MPLPVLHTYTGYAVYRLMKKEEAPDVRFALLCMAMANLADFDFLPGILTGHAGRFHHGISHSFGAAVLCGLAAALIARLWKRRAFIKTFLISSLAYATHIVLDVIQRPEEKIPVFWPLISAPVSFTKESLHSFHALAQSPEAAKTGWAQFTAILWGREAFERLAFELLCIITTMAVFIIYHELKNHSLQLQQEKPAQAAMKSLPAGSSLPQVMMPASFFKESANRASSYYAKKSD